MKFEFEVPQKEVAEGIKKLDTVYNVNRFSQSSLLSLIAISLAACGGGGGGGGSPSDPDPVDPPELPPAGNGLSLYKVGSVYQSSSFDGISVSNGNAHLTIEDSFEDVYNVKLSAEGAGLLTFEFVDADDVVTLLNGTEIAGFSQLKVINGTIDATDADLGLIDYVTVASSVKLTASQLLNMENLVISSPSGGIEVEIMTETQLTQISNALSSGNLNIYSPGGLITYVKASGSALSASEISSAEQAINQETLELTSLNSSELTQSYTFLAQRSYATLSIENDNVFINDAESDGDIKFLVNASTGYTIKSVKIGNVSLQKVDGFYVLNLNSQYLSDGVHEVVVELENASISSAGIDQYLQSTIFLTADVIIDRTGPASPVINITGESNSLNAFEASSEVGVKVLLSQGEEVVSVSLDGDVLTGSGSNFSLNAADLTDGNYNLVVVTKDSAGNSLTTNKSFTIDLDAVQEPTVVINGGNLLIGGEDANGTVEISLSLNGVAQISSVAVGSMDAQVLSGNNYSFNAAALPEGTNTVVVTSDDGLGGQIITESDFVIDRTPPNDPIITIVDQTGGLTASERVEPVTVVVEAEPGVSILDVRVDGGSSLSSRSAGVYELNARNLESGEHELIVTSSDDAGNTLVSRESFMVVDYTLIGANIFEFRSEVQNDIVTFSAYIKNAPSTLPDGIPSFDYLIDLDNDELDYIEGSFQAASGAIYRINENVAQGDIFASGIFLNPWNQYEEAFFTFEARTEHASSAYELSFSNFNFYTTDINDFVVLVDV